MRTIEVDLRDVLDLIVAAEDYGYNNDVLMSSFAQWIGHITDDEIKEFANSYSSNEGYGEEDRAEAISRFTAWRDKYA